MQITKQIQNGALAIIFLAALLLPLTGLRQLASAAADTCTWTGGGADMNVSTAANWTGCDNGTVPEDGDILEFDSDSFDFSGYDTVLNNDSLTTIAGVSLSGTSTTQFGSVDIDGNALSLTGGVSDTSAVDSYMTIEFSADVTLGANIVDTSIRFANLDMSTYDITNSGTETVRISGTLVGSGNITSERLYLYGDSSAYTGDIVVEDLNLTGTTSVGDLSGTVTVGDYLCLGYGAGNYSIAKAITLAGSLYAGESCGGGGGVPTVDGTVTFTGLITLSGDTTVYATTKNIVFENLDESTFTMDLAGTSNGSLDKGDGAIEPEKTTTTIGEADKSSASIAIQNNETVVLNGERGQVSVNSGGVLKGTGTVTGNVTVNDGGLIAPGLSPGCITVGGDFSIDGEYEFEIEGETVCTEYDQVDVTGAVDVTSSVLTISRLSTFVPELNTEFVIINNEGTDDVVGEFSGWAQGAQVVVDQVTYEIDYAGGDGNDVVLTVVAIDSALVAEADTPDTGLQSVLANPMIGVATLVISAGTLALLKKKQLI